MRGDLSSAVFMSPPPKELSAFGVERQVRATSHRLKSQVDWRITGNQRRRGVNPEACAADVRFGSVADIAKFNRDVGFVPEADIGGSPTKTAWWPTPYAARRICSAGSNARKAILPMMAKIAP